VRSIVAVAGRLRAPLLCCAAACWLLGCEPARPGRPAPAFDLADAHGRRVTLASFAGHPVLLAFWASWARPCRIAVPRWVRLARTWGHRGAALVVIAVGDEAAAVDKAWKDRAPGVPVLLGDEATTRNYFGKADVVLPTLLVVDARGVIRARLAGLGREDEAEAALGAALGDGGASSTPTEAHKE